MAKLPQAVSGAGGHSATFFAALVAVKGFDLPEEDALRLMREWNQTHCVPPWTDADILRKVRSASKSMLPSGYLLKDRFEGGVMKAGTKSCHSGPKQIPRGASHADRSRWPEFYSLSDRSMETIARSRQVPLMAVAMAAHQGLLRGAVVDGHSCFVMCEGSFAQARRLDGQPLTLRDGQAVKAKNLPGSRGAFIGLPFLGDQGHTGGPPKVLMVEGAIGWLEGAGAAILMDADASGWTVLAATSASSRFDPEWLGRLAGRRVRIVPDADTMGYEAAGIWAADLRRIGCDVDAVRLPEGCKDLGALLANIDAHRSSLSRIFED